VRPQLTALISLRDPEGDELLLIRRQHRRPRLHREDRPAGGVPDSGRPRQARAVIASEVPIAYDLA
jgi:hypothetical protein